MQKAYVAGPMRHIKEFNFPAFFAAEDQLRLDGWEVFNPARHDLEMGFNPEGMTGEEEPEGFGIRDCMNADLNWITKNADAVFALPGWEKSKGAVAEMAAAFSIGADTFTIEGKPITELPSIKKARSADLKVDDGNPKDAIGSRKVPMSIVPAVAIAEESLAMLEGKCKYGAWNFRGSPVRASIYLDACGRHLAKWQNGQDRDPEDKVHHLGYARACLGIILDAECNRTLIDDRPPENPFVIERIDALAKAVESVQKTYGHNTPKHWTINR